MFREGDEADGAFRLVSGTVDVIRELDGHPILLGKVGAGQFIGEMGIIENRRRSATVRAASEVEAEVLSPAEFLDQIANSPATARELIRRLSQRLREADDRIVKDEKESGQAERHLPADDTTVARVQVLHLSAKSEWVQRGLHTPIVIGERPFIIGRAPFPGEGQPSIPPDLQLEDALPFRLSRNHFVIESRNGDYHVRDLRSTPGTVVNGEPIGVHFRSDDAPLRSGENEIVAGGMDSPFSFVAVVE